MNQKLILSLLVGSIACGLTAKVAVVAPASVEEAIVQEEVTTSRLAKLRNAFTYPVRKQISIARGAAGYAGDATFYSLRKGQSAYNYAAETRYGSAVRNLLVNTANNREVVGALSTLALVTAGYKFGKTKKGRQLRKATKKNAKLVRDASSRRVGELVDKFNGNTSD